MTDVALPQRVVPTLALTDRLSSDERLAQLASRGDSRAFGLLYERHRQALYGYCRSIVRNEEDAHDALQSAVMRALAALQKSERDIAVRPWLFRIVHNEAISLLRRRRPEDRPIDEQELAHVSIEHTVEGRERLATLVADIQSLVERQRAALLMRELSGLSMEEIAAALEISPGAAKQALFEARCALHQLAEGRAMECDDVRRTLSERDGRVLRGRKLRAHLRACAGCVQFRTLIDARGADLRALVPPLPAVGGALGLLAHAADVAGGHASEAAAVSGVTFGAPATISLVAKGLAGAAIMTAATVGTAELVRHQAQPSAVAAPQPTIETVAWPLQAPTFTVHLQRSGPPRAVEVRGERQAARDDVTARTIHGSGRAIAPGGMPSPESSVSPGVSPVAANPPSSTSAPPDIPTTPGKSSSAPGKRSTNGASDSTPPGLAESDGVPPGLAKQGKDTKPPGNPHTDPSPQAQGPVASAPATPNQPGPPSPGHSQDPHGYAPQSSSDAGHPGPPASH